MLTSTYNPPVILTTTRHRDVAVTQIRFYRIDVALETRHSVGFDAIAGSDLE